MAGDVEFNVTAKDKSGSALAAMEAKFKATQDRITKDSDKVSTSLGKIGDAGSKNVSKLHRELDLAKKDLSGLAQSFAGAQSAAERLDISKAIRKQQTEIRNLSKTLKIIDEDKVSEDLTKSVDKAAPNIIESLKSTFGVAGVSGGPVLAAGIAAAAPVIGGLISAAIIGGAGVGGVIGGVLLASKDPRIKQAGSDLGKNLLGELKQSASVFVDPLFDSIQKVEARFSSMNSRVASIFKNSSGFLGPLTDGLLDAVDGVLRGVDALVAKGKPVIDALGRSFGILGDATGDAFEIISGGADDSASALENTAKAVGTLIRGVGYLVRGLTDLYGIVSYVPSKIQGLSRAITGYQDSERAASTTGDIMAAVQKNLAVITLSTGEAAGKAGLQMQTYADKMADATTKGRGLYDSQTSVAQAVSDARKALDENGRSLDVNTQKGRDNRTALSNLASSLTANYQAYVAVNGQGRAAQTVATNNRSAFIKLATQFGLSKKAAADLATQMGLLKPKTIDFHANTHDAEGRIKALRGQIAATKGKTINVDVIVNTSRLNAVEARLSRLHGEGALDANSYWAAVDGSGGRSRSGGPTPVGNVNVSNDVSVSLDGAPFYAVATKVTRARAERDAWRQKVGKR